MKKINNNGFILAETLIVAVFLVVIFTMIYSNYYPLIGEYEKRENYDDVDGKYTAYWIKKMIESNDYSLSLENIRMLNTLGFTRFECDNMNHDKLLCQNLVKSLHIARCDEYGNGCDIYLTRFRIDTTSSPVGPEPPSFKNAVRGTLADQNSRELTRENENNVKNNSAMFNDSSDLNNINSQFDACCRGKEPSLNCQFTDYNWKYDSTASSPEKEKIVQECYQKSYENWASFLSPTKDYILTLPRYLVANTTTQAKFRVIVVVHNNLDGNDFYSFSNMEVVR